MKYLFGFLTIVMISFVFVQYNDPDPILWMIIYGFCALLMLLSALGHASKTLIYVAYFLFGGGFLYLLPSTAEFILKERGDNFLQQMNYSKPYIEETRECLGLLVCLTVTSLMWIPIKRSK